MNKKPKRQTYLELIIRSNYNFFICFFKKKLNTFQRKWGYPFNENPNSYDDLTPTIIEEDIYINSIVWALKNNNVKNLALTGSYGSGKSSILKTLKHTHPEFYYLNISLATFEDEFGKEDKAIDLQTPAKKPTKEENEALLKYRDELNKKIELSILQQMLYSERSSKLPNSRFRRIKNFKSHFVLTSTLLWFIVGVSYLNLFNKSLLSKIKLYESHIKGSSLLDICSLITLVLGLLYILKSFIKSLYQFRFSKVNSKGEIELNREIDDSSILNKNIDEIVYFFEKTNYNIVIIEDLDRFKEPEIFTKLREINLLLNNSRQINRHITFIYALKDEMFKDGNRTKFFDYIVPVIPVINSSNSYDLLSDKLTNEDISEKLLDDISLYIDDMRLLKNIINEYKVYKAKLTIDKAYNSNLLAFVIYKNKFPEDFSELHFNRGMIYEVFDKDENKIKKKQIAKHSSNINLLNTEIETITSFHVTNVDELRKIYILKIIEGLPTDHFFSNFHLSRLIRFNDIISLISDEIFKEIVKLDTVYYKKEVFNNSSRRMEETTGNFSFKKIEQQIDSTQTYEEKETLVLNKTNEQLNKLRVQIRNEELLIDKIKSSDISELIKESNDGLNIKIKKEDILVYFLRNNLIDKNYWYYISILHETEKGISKNDQNFILAIRNRKPQELNYKLNNIERVLIKLENDFDREEILNLQLLEHLYLKENTFKINQYFSLYNDISERKLKFLNLYLEKGNDVPRFIKSISSAWFGFWDYIYEKSTYLEEQRETLFKDILLNAFKADIINQNRNANVSKYIENKSNFLDVFNNPINNERIGKILQFLNIKFKVPLDSIQANIDLFDNIYEKGFYQISPEMIKFILSQKGNLTKDDLSNFYLSNYSIVRKSTCESLIKYIDNNINVYVNSVLLFYDESSNDEVDVIYLLNHKNVTIDNKIYIIEQEKSIINKITDINEKKLWAEIFQLNKVNVNWDNIFNYYKDQTLDDVLITYLNSIDNSNQLSLSKIQKDKIGETQYTEFIKLFLLTEDIDNKSYSNLLKSVPYRFKSLTFEVLSSEKVSLLIKKNVISFTISNFNKIQENFNRDLVYFIENNSQDFIDNLGDLKLNEGDIEIIFKSQQLSTGVKKTVYSNTDQALLLSNQEIIKVLASLVVDKDFEISKELLLQSYTNSKIITTTKIMLVIKTIKQYDTAEITNILCDIGYPYSKLTAFGKRPSIPYNEINFELTTLLDKMNYISTSTKSGNEIKLTTFKTRHNIIT